MRGTILAVSFLALGAFAMPKQARAQEKKEAFLRYDKTDYTERVTIKRIKPGTKDEFFDPVKGVWAARRDVKGKGLMFHVLGTTKPDADLNPDLDKDLTTRARVMIVIPGAGSVLTDNDGNEYVITEAEGESPAKCWVKLTKAAPKKR